MRYDNPVIDDIERKLKVAEGSPDYFLARGNCIKRDLLRREILQSYLIEHPSFANFGEGKTKRSRSQLSEARVILRTGIKRLYDSWHYLVQNVPSVVEDLTSANVIDLGNIINGTSGEAFRNVRVSMNLPNYTPPNPLKVPEMMEDLLTEVKAEDLHPIERAFYLHLGVASTQPFCDGNKRVARMLQNKSLDEQWLPPATIHFSERRKYIDLLEGAMNGYREKDFKKQGPFFQYMAKKLAESFEY